jgi:UDP-GlcNAc3NAcA epimerase
LAEAGIREFLVHTGQHSDAAMSEVSFDELGIPTPANLECGSGTHAEQTTRMMLKIEPVLCERRPNLALSYGDANSTLAGALAAAKLRIPVAHVEAGLRSCNRVMPEEVNRVVADALSDLLLAPTQTAVANLRRVNVPVEPIKLVGDVMYETPLAFGEKASCKGSILQRLDLRPQSYLLATIQRPENTDDAAALAKILGGLREAARKHRVVRPAHPRTRKALLAAKTPGLTSGLDLIEPLGYLDMVQRERNAGLIVTDTGSVQKEALFHGVRCLAVRTETAWTELLDSGCNSLGPPSSARAVEEGIESSLGSTGRKTSFYGDGHTAKRVAEVLARFAGIEAEAGAAR